MQSIEKERTDLTEEIIECIVFKDHPSITSYISLAVLQEKSLIKGRKIWGFFKFSGT